MRPDELLASSRSGCCAEGWVPLKFKRGALGRGAYSRGRSVPLIPVIAARSPHRRWRYLIAGMALQANADLSTQLFWD